MDILDIFIVWFLEIIYDPIKNRFGVFIATSSILFNTAAIIAAGKLSVKEFIFV